MKFNYHEKFDTLYVIFGDAEKPAEYIENDNGDLIRFTPENGQIVGITVFDFMKRLRSGKTIEFPEVGILPFNSIMHSIVRGNQSGAAEH